MGWSRFSKAVGLVVLATVAAVLVGAPPASADMTVDSAVCIHNATSTLTSPRPTIVLLDESRIDYPLLTWSATVLSTFCSQANARLFLVLDTGGQSPALPAIGSAEVFFPGVWTLRLRTLLDQKDLASITVTVVG